MNDKNYIILHRYNYDGGGLTGASNVYIEYLTDSYSQRCWSDDINDAYLFNEFDARKKVTQLTAIEHTSGIDYVKVEITRHRNFIGK